MTSTITVIESPVEPIVLIDYIIGPQGPSGNTILNGYDVPLDNIGTIGDFYLNISNKKIYGPKSASGWSIGIDLSNSQGYVSIPFSYGDVYPKPLTIIPSNKIISKIEVIINNVFDTDISFEITNTVGECLFNNEQIDGFVKGIYQSCPVKYVSIPTELFLTISSNNIMSSGSGIVLIYIEETT